MPRRQRGEGSVFKRSSDGLWVGRIDLGWSDGKRKRKQVTGRTQAEVVKKLREARKKVDAGDRTTAGMTVARWLSSWLEEVCPGKPKMRPRTLSNYRAYVRNYLEPSIGNVRLDRLAPQHVRQLHKFMRDLGLSETTVGHAHRILGTALNDAMREGLLTRNVVTLVPKPANTPNQRRPLSLEEVRRFFAVTAGDRMASRWHTAFLLGIRQGECLGLRWEFLDLENGTADVAWQLQRIPYKHDCGEKPNGKPKCGRSRADRCPERALDVSPAFKYVQLDGNLCLQAPKTEGSTRLIPLPAQLVVSLRERREQYLAERDHYEVDHGLVWARRDGRPVDGSQDRAAWHAILEAADIPATDQHSARHTTATLLLAMRVPEHVIMSILGHSEVVTTRGYAHADLTMQREAMGELGSVLLLPSVELD